MHLLAGTAHLFVSNPKNKLHTETTMKTPKRLLQTMVAAVVAGVAMLAFNTVSAAEILKGGQVMMKFSELKTEKEVKDLKENDSIAMVCSKCKTVMVGRVKQGAKGAEVMMAGGPPKEFFGKHTCEGCKSEIEIVGVGKGKERVIKHSCKACGEGSAFCCATKADAPATKGMEKK